MEQLTQIHLNLSVYNQINCSSRVDTGPNLLRCQRPHKSKGFYSYPRVLFYYYGCLKLYDLLQENLLTSKKCSYCSYCCCC